jgi:TonB-dependent Receptor Plug Domain
MKTLTPVRKKILLLSALIPACIVLGSFTLDSDTLESILKKMQQYHTERPQEKLYLHFDKPFYAAGEDVWFKAYIMEASMHSLDSQSSVVYVELINDAQTIVSRKVLYAAGGVTFGDFQLPDTLQEGRYLIRAYTNYMRNAGEDFFFKKELTLLNPVSGTREKAPLAPDSIDLQFFPEGGNLVACGFNRIAFKALSPDGKSIAIEGELVDENNTLISTFKTQHDGMGVLRLNPAKGKKYYALITKPYAVNRVYALPEVHEKGYTMQVDPAGKNIKVLVFTNADKPAIHVVVQSRGNVYYAQPGNLNGNAFFNNIPKSKFPDGISQITVFDAEGRPVAERLIYQSHNESINLLVEADTNRYGKRKLVTVYADAKYRNGAPAQGNFSIAVYDEGLINDPDTYPLTITNYLSLTSDLKGHIDNPGYYFKDSLTETRKNLDLLMMVHGWRRFTWNDVLVDKLSEQNYKREKGLPLSGRVLKAGGKKAPANSILKVVSMDGNIIILKPDSTGAFYTDDLLFYDSMKLAFQTENEKGKKQPYKFALDPFNPSPASSHPFTSFVAFDASPFLKQQAEEKLVINSQKVKVFDEVKVVAKRERDPRLIGMAGADRLVDPQKLSQGYANVFQMLQSQVPGVIVTGNPPNMSILIRNKPPIYLYNGMVVEADFISTISPTEIDYVEILGPGSASRYGGTSALNIVPKAGGGTRETIGVNSAKYPGFYQSREFYSPRYDVPDNRHSFDDKRTTLFWMPILETDENGRAAVSFFTADAASSYRIVMEGITYDGYPGTASSTFKVE